MEDDGETANYLSVRRLKKPNNNSNKKNQEPSEKINKLQEKDNYSENEPEKPEFNVGYLKTKEEGIKDIIGKLETSFTLHKCHSEKNLIGLIERKELELGIIPFEDPEVSPLLKNTLEALFQSNQTKIVADLYLEIPEQYLCSFPERKKSEIQEIISTGQILSSAKEHISKNYPEAKIKCASSVDGAGKKIRRENMTHAAIIAPEEIMRTYHLKTLEQNVCSDQIRYLILGKEENSIKLPDKNKTFIKIQTNGENAGKALRLCLTQLDLDNINILYDFHYRKNGSFEYYAELGGHYVNKKFRRTLERLGKTVVGEDPNNKVSILGSFLDREYFNISKD